MGIAAMDNPRQQRGLEIAATKVITQKGNVWMVPSQSKDTKYTVRPHADKPWCSCPDHDTRGVKCKHIFAVEYAIEREQNKDGSTTVTETVQVKETVKRQTYSQDWSNYNRAQTNEKDKFLSLLFDLCRGVETPIQKNGRPRLPYADAIFAACFKVYSTVSGRRFMSDLRAAQFQGFISKTPHFNSIFNTLDNAELTPILIGLITESSKPLKMVETDFAVDSSGFSSCRFVKWFDEKYGKEKSGRDWVKVHICCGVKTNVVTAVEIPENKCTNDSMLFPQLLKGTAKNFNISEVSGDKAYCSLANCDLVHEAGGTPFFALKRNATGKSGGMYQKMYHYFAFRQDEFLRHYHKRSNVESCFSMMKAKFKDNVRSKTDTAMKNEALCKILCHNICCLIHEMYALGIEPEFWQTKAVANVAI
jgi:transposase/predicted nucleic acid-binding Zn finger protein